MKLTIGRVKALKPTGAAQDFHWCDDTKGFGVRVTRSGAKSWICQGRVNGRTRRVTIGKVDLMGAETARKRAQQALLDMYDGLDPQALKAEEAAMRITLREVMEEYIANKQTKNGPLRPGSVKDYRHVVDTVFADWADKPVANITKDACIKKFQQMSKSGPVYANQAFRYLRALLNRAREQSVTNEGFYTLLPVNPVSQMAKVSRWNPEKPRDTRIPLEQVHVVWKALTELSNYDANVATTCTSADLVMFMLLTGSRAGESKTLSWDQVDLDSEVATYTFIETKNHNPVTLPVSDALRVLLLRRLAAKQGDNPYVFPAVRGKTKYISDVRAVLKKVEAMTGVKTKPHDLRRTFDDIAQEVNVDPDKRRQLLNHVASDVHGRSYSNNPDPRSLLKAVNDVGNWVTQ